MTTIENATPYTVFIYPNRGNGSDICLERNGPTIFSIKRGPLGWSTTVDPMYCFHSDEKAIEFGLSELKLQLQSESTSE